MDRFLERPGGRERLAQMVAQRAAKATAVMIHRSGLGQWEIGKPKTPAFQWPDAEQEVEGGLWNWLKGTATDAAGYVQDVIIGAPTGTTAAQKENLEHLEELAQQQKAERQAAGESTATQDMVLNQVSEMESELLAPTSVFVKETVSELYNRTKSMFELFPWAFKMLPLVLLGVGGFVAYRYATALAPRKRTA
jgi:hypothetical protein